MSLCARIMYLYGAFSIFLAAGANAQLGEKLPPPCDSKVYCYGELLHKVQLSGVFNDSKTFVDMSLKNTQEKTLEDFDKFMQEHVNATKEQIKKFVDAHFVEPGTEFESWEPEDWHPSPKFLENIVHPDLQKFGESLHKLWKELGRKISDKVKEEPSKYSQIYLPNPVIVPGGRFREVYYWDSYWTMEGLLLSDMGATVKGMLENFVSLIGSYGMVPNGGRVYYTRRSQPPYLIPMFKLYYDHTNDKDFISDNIEFLEKEFEFWRKNRTIHVRDATGKVHNVTHYNVQVGEPRPESYKEDYHVAENLETESEKEKLYVEFKSGAESGWDYSTRWFVMGDTNKGNLSNLNTTSIAPVDLNSLLCSNAKQLADFHSILGNEKKSDYYRDIALEKNKTMAAIFWDEKDGVWYDINVHNTDVEKRKRRYFYMSNVHPIWSDCFGHEEIGGQKKVVERIINYLKKEKVINYVGGMPTSMNDSGQQWDFPNAWAPLQHNMIMGLYNKRHLNSDAEELAYELAEKWVRSNYNGFKQYDNAMFEKYDVTSVGQRGGGGEYEVQLGFGWSNGVAMKLLHLFGDRLTPVTGSGVQLSPSSWTLALLPTFAISLSLLV